MFVGRDDLQEDAGLADPVRRNGRLQELYGVVAAAMPDRTTAQWVHDLLEADILFGEVFSPEQLTEDPHLRAMGMFPEADHPTEGRIRLIGMPVQSSANATALSRLPPVLGQHSREILLEAGLTGGEIDELVRSGAVVDADPARRR